MPDSDSGRRQVSVSSPVSGEHLSPGQQTDCYRTLEAGYRRRHKGFPGTGVSDGMHLV